MPVLLQCVLQVETLRCDAAVQKKTCCLFLPAEVRSAIHSPQRRNGMRSTTVYLVVRSCIYCTFNDGAHQQPVPGETNKKNIFELLFPGNQSTPSKVTSVLASPSQKVKVAHASPAAHQYARKVLLHAKL